MKHTYNPSTQQAEAGGSLQVYDQPGQQNAREEILLTTFKAASIYTWYIVPIHLEIKLKSEIKANTRSTYSLNHRTKVLVTGQYFQAISISNCGG